MRKAGTRPGRARETRQGLSLYFRVWWEDCRPRGGTGRMHMYFWDHSSCPAEKRLAGAKGNQRDQALVLVNSNSLNTAGYVQQETRMSKSGALLYLLLHT